MKIYADLKSPTVGPIKASRKRWTKYTGFVKDYKSAWPILEMQEFSPLRKTSGNTVL